MEDLASRHYDPVVVEPNVALARRRCDHQGTCAERGHPRERRVAGHKCVATEEELVQQLQQREALVEGSQLDWRAIGEPA